MAHNAAGHSTLDLRLGAPKSFRNFKLPNQYFMVSTRQGSGPLLSRVCARTRGPDGSEWLEGPPCLGWGGFLAGFSRGQSFTTCQDQGALASHVVPMTAFKGEEA